MFLRLLTYGRPGHDPHAVYGEAAESQADAALVEAEALLLPLPGVEQAVRLSGSHSVKCSADYLLYLPPYIEILELKFENNFEKPCIFLALLT